MLNLATPASAIQILTGVAVTSIAVHASFVDLGLTSTTVTPGSLNTLITGATTTTVAPGPAVNIDRNVKFLSINNESNTTCPLLVQLTDGTNVVTIFGPIDLDAGWTIQYNSDGNGFVVYDAAGNIQIASNPAVLAIVAGISSGSGAIVFGDANNVSFGFAGAVITATAAASVVFSAGTTSSALSTIVFSNANNVMFGLAGSVVTASAIPMVGQVVVFSQDADFVTNFLAVVGVMSIQKLSLPLGLDATQLAIIADFGGFSTASGAVTVSHAVYTLNAGTANLASSASRAFSWASGSATNISTQFGGASGTRYRTLDVAYNMTPGDYLFAWNISTQGAVNCTVFGRAAMNIVGGYDGFETSAFINGVSTVGVFPTSIGATDTGYVRTGVSALRQPGAILIGI